MAELEDRPGSASAEARAERKLVDCQGSEPGPLFIVTGGMHGNEPAGVHAIRRVARTMTESGLKPRGRMVGLAGNLEALASGRRFLESDLNRMWSEDMVDAARTTMNGSARAEYRELAELALQVEGLLSEHTGEVIFLDLHSTSGDGPPFALIGDTLQNRRVAFAFGLPVILGLEENVEDTLLGYFGERGHMAIGVEGGQHDKLTTIDHHESALWIALVAAGLFVESEVPGYAEHRERLALATDGLPRVVEILHRHWIEPEYEFRMADGFRNFQPVRKGTQLARTGNGSMEDVKAPLNGILLLPRYQGLGQEGFFIGREVRRFWLAVSAGLRKLRLEALLAAMPGVKRVSGGTGQLEVNPHVARICPVQVFHLLGYRKRESHGDRLVFTRRLESALPRETRRTP